MAYQTGTATGPSDLLDKLRIFLEAQGWTTNDHSADGTGYRLHVEKSPQLGGDMMYFNFRSAVAESGITGDGYHNSYYDDPHYHDEITGIAINGSTGYDAGEDWDEQPGFIYSPDYGSDQYSCAMGMVEMSISAIPAYYFFAVGDSIHVVVETISGVYQFMSFGTLEKQGVYTGGQYFSASFASRYWYSDYYSTNGQVPNYFSACQQGYNHGGVYLDVDSTADWRTSDGEYEPEIKFPCVFPSRNSDNNYTYCNGLAGFFHRRSPNYYNNIATMCPIYVLGKRSSGNYSLLGWPEGVRYVNVLNYSAGQEITYGSETWKVFQEKSYDDFDNQVTSKYANCGFAFKKET